MKKLIGLLGAAGLLIPSAAMAGSINHSSGSEALRTSAASDSTTTVNVVSGIRRDNAITVTGSSYGTDFSISAEDYMDGTRHYHFGTYDLTAQNSSDVKLDAEAAGSFNVHDTSIDGHTYDHTTDTYEAQAAVPGSTESSCAYRHYLCHHTETHPIPAEPHSVHTYGTSGDTHVGSLVGMFDGKAKGTFDALSTIDSQGTLIGGTGNGAFKNGTYSQSEGGSSSSLNGTLKEKGLTTTTVDSTTHAVATSNGFESSNFNKDDWN
jgi:hypothetical protein